MRTNLFIANARFISLRILTLSPCTSAGMARPSNGLMQSWSGTTACLLLLLFSSPPVDAECKDDNEAFYNFKNEIPNRKTGEHELRGIQGFPAAEYGVDQPKE